MILIIILNSIITVAPNLRLKSDHDHTNFLVVIKYTLLVYD